MYNLKLYAKVILVLRAHLRGYIYLDCADKSVRRDTSREEYKKADATTHHLPSGNDGQKQSHGQPFFSSS